MKKPAQIENLADRLTAAATTPALTITKPASPKAVKGAGSMSVFLRVPADIYDRLKEEATSRTKATGEGVTVQQVILSKLG